MVKANVIVLGTWSLDHGPLQVVTISLEVFLLHGHLITLTSVYLTDHILNQVCLVTKRHGSELRQAFKQVW